MTPRLVRSAVPVYLWRTFPPLSTFSSKAMKRVLPLLAVITLAACSGEGGGPTPPPEQPKVASLDFTAPADSVEELKTLQLTAVPKDKNGNAMTTHVWLTVDSSRIASVHEQTRVLEAKAPGFVTVTATSENITKTMKVRVTPFGPTPPADRPGGWKVFLLMGQSNMEGQGSTVATSLPICRAASSCARTPTSSPRASRSPPSARAPRWRSRSR